MADFVKHTPCDSCGSSDARAIYNDGSEHCFSCRAHKNGNSIARLKVGTKPKGKRLYNSTASIRQDAFNWLDSYGLSAQEKAMFVWDEQKELLIYEEEKFTNGRYFGKEDRPRYLSSGEKPFSLMGRGRGVVFVEDIISGIKVSRHTQTMTLFGSSIPSQILWTTATTRRPAAIWLDSDKAMESAKMVKKINESGGNAVSIITKLDPKCYTDEEILQILHSNRVYCGN